MKKRKFRLWIVLVVGLAILWFLQALLVPKYMESTQEGALISEYYCNAGGNEVIFIGDCEVYENFSPVTLWEEYGITSYDFGANEQPMYLSYYYIKEAIKYQDPKAIVLEVSYCNAPEYTHEGVHHINLDDLRMGKTKLEAIFDIIPAGERWPYIFELAKYHDTWTTLDQHSLEYITANKHNPYKGYTPSLDGFADGGTFNEEIAKVTEKSELAELSVTYMEKIIALCKEENVDLVFLKTPNDHIQNQPDYNAVGDIAERHNIPYLDLNKEMKGQLHNHVFHAETITKRIGQWLTELYEVEDKRENPKFAEWHEDADYYYRYAHQLRLNDIEFFEEYVAELVGKDYVVCFAVNQDAGAYLSEEAVSLMQKLGCQWDVSAAGGNSYLAVVENGVIHAETGSEEIVAYENRIHEHRFSVISQGAQAGCNASIQVDGIEYEPNEKGFNVVVYDPKLDMILSSKSFEITE